MLKQTIILLLVICVSDAAAQQFEYRSDSIIYRGNIFELHMRPNIDRVTLIDVATGSDRGGLGWADSIPAKMNGNTIYREDKLTTPPQPAPGNASIVDYVYNQVTEDLNELPDGVYRLEIDNIVIDASGHVVFYQGVGIHPLYNKRELELVADIINLSSQTVVISEGTKLSINFFVDKALNTMPALIPGSLGGKPVIVLTNNFFISIAL